MHQIALLQFYYDCVLWRFLQGIIPICGSSHDVQTSEGLPSSMWTKALLAPLCITAAAPLSSHGYMEA